MREKNVKRVVLFLLFCLLSGTVQVRADVIFEPLDLFYARNKEDCDYHARSYIANGPKGKIAVYASPEAPITIVKIANGEYIWVDYVYTDQNGTVWGYTADENAVGWVPMPYLYLRYDNLAFREDFGDKIVSGQGQLDSSYEEKTGYFWRYPGSDSGRKFKIDTNHLQYNDIFVDEEGRSWGYVGYYFGRENSWICVDDPTADFDELYPEGAPVRDTTVMEEYTGKRIIPRLGLLFVVGAAVIVTAIVTVGLLIYMKKSKKKMKKKKSQPEENDEKI